MNGRAVPGYLDEASLYGEDSPCVCLRAAFFQGDSPSHRDFLGALMGAGVGRETVKSRLRYAMDKLRARLPS